MRRRTVLAMLCSAAASRAQVRPWSAPTQAGLTFLEFGRRAMAEEQLKRALFQARASNADEATIAQCLENLADATTLDKSGTSLRVHLYQESLALRERAMGPEAPETARSLMRLAMATAYDGPAGQVEQMLGRALRIADSDSRGAFKADALDLLGASRHLFYASNEDGMRSRVSPLYRAALKIRSQLPGDDGIDLALADELDQLTVLEQFRNDAQSRPLRQKHLDKLTGRTAAARTLSAGRDVVPPSVISRIQPEWSEFGAKVRLEGTVKMDVQVTEQGTAGEVWLTRSMGLGLDEQAYFAVREWRFRPAESGGRPVPGTLAVEVNFHL